MNSTRIINFRPCLITVFVLASMSATHGQTQWNYTAMGDSLATAYSVPGGSGYVPTYQGYIQTDTGAGVTLYNLGQNGWTSSNLLNALRTNSVFQNSVVQSHVITWNIGINDLRNARNTYKNKKCGGSDNQDCLRSMVTKFNSNWDAIISEVLVRRSSSNTVIRTIDIYNPWVKTDTSKNTTQDRNETSPKGNDFEIIKYYLDQMNAHIAASATTFEIPSAQVYLAFNGASGTEQPMAKGLVGADELHPTVAGHKLIADLLRGLGYAPAAVTVASSINRHSISVDNRKEESRHATQFRKTVLCHPLHRRHLRRSLHTADLCSNTAL